MVLKTYKFFNDLMYSMKWNGYFDVSEFQNEWMSREVGANFRLKDRIINIIFQNLTYDAIGMHQNNVSSIHYS